MPTHPPSERTYSQKDAQKATAYVAKIADEIKRHYARKLVIEEIIKTDGDDLDDIQRHRDAVAYQESFIERCEDELMQINVYVTHRELAQVMFPAEQAGNVWIWRPGMQSVKLVRGKSPPVDESA